MKAIKLFNILSVILNCGIVSCSTENYQVYSIENVNKESWIKNFNSESTGAEKCLFGIIELSSLNQMIENICETIEPLKKNKTENALLYEDLLKIVRKVDRNSFKNIRCFKYERLLKGLDNTNALLNQFLVLLERQQGENRETVLKLLNGNVVNELQDLDDMLSKIEEKLFNQEESESEVSYLTRWGRRDPPVGHTKLSMWTA
jgi:hypothetical protein